MRWEQEWINAVWSTYPLHVRILGRFIATAMWLGLIP